jgi:Phage conserved hypothetical protein BR0599/Uncharacterized conserved protein (DUF2163)
MRTVVDNIGVTSGVTKALINAGVFARADLLTFSLTSGIVLRYANWDWPVVRPTNMLLYSQQVATVTPPYGSFGSGMTIGSNAAVAPDGTTTASSIHQTNNDSSIYQDIVWGGTQQGTFSAYVKAGTGCTALQLVIWWFTGGAQNQNVNLVMNPATGAFISVNTTLANLLYYAITSVGSGWYRISISGIGTDPNNTKVRCQIYDVSGGASTYYTWGWQFEPSATVRPYVVTTASAVIGGIWSNSGPLCIRDTVKHKRGVEVDELTLTVIASQSNLVLGSMGWPQAAASGVLDGAQFSLDFAFWSLPVAINASPSGFMNWFSGYVDEIPSVDPPNIELLIKSDLGKLTMPWPRNYYQASCVNTLFDQACGANPATYAQNGSVTTVNVDGSFVMNFTNVAGYWAMGTIYWTKGANAGLGRSIKNSSSGTPGGTIWLYEPLPNSISIGDTFTIYPGCDKTLSGGCNKFWGTNSVLHFRGTPFVPPPDTSLL